jgi:hypothetical protein
MDAVKTQLKVLLECLGTKESALRQIANITENQGFILSSGMADAEIRAFFTQMNEEKQAFIDTVLNCDRVFEGVLRQIGRTLDEDPASYKDEVLELQDAIRRVMDLDVHIRVMEDNNSKFAGGGAAAADIAGDNEKVSDDDAAGEAYGENGGGTTGSADETADADDNVEASDDAAANNASGAAGGGGKPAKIDSGEYGSRKVIKAYENQSRNI